MKTLWILAAAATFAACHNRSSDETGAAPDRGDTTAVQSGYDTTSNTGAVKTDSAMTPSADTSSTAAPAPAPAPTTDTTSTTVPQTGAYDSTSTSQPTSPSTGVTSDSTMAPPSDSGSMGTDTSSMSSPSTDSSSTQR